MATSKAVVPRPTDTKHTTALTHGQKIIGVCLLLFYVAMIGITIATLPYVADVENRAVFERAGGSF
jgi:hypothetical protein